MFGIGVQELAIIFVVALLIFGPKRLPEFARSLGKGLAEFRRASSDLRQSFSLDVDPPDLASRNPSAQSSDQPDPRTSETEPEPPPQAVDAAFPDASPEASLKAAAPETTAPKTTEPETAAPKATEPEAAEPVKAPGRTDSA
jgi:TatA/E family protein of Tat protein translocase